MKKYTIAIVILLWIGSVNGQILKVIEESNGKKTELGTCINMNIAEINSMMEVYINKDELIKRVGKSSGMNPNLLNKVDKLNTLLSSQIEILESLNLDFSNLSQEAKIERLGQYSNLMDEFYSKLRESNNQDIKDDVKNFYLEYIDLRKKSQIDIIEFPNPQKYAIIKLSEESDSLIKNIGSSDDLQKIQFQLLAALSSGSGIPLQVHVENYDTFTEGELFEIPRWVTTFSDEDIAKFEELKEQSNYANSLLDYDIKNLGADLEKNFESMYCIAELISNIEDFGKKPGTSFTNPEQKISFETVISKLRKEYDNYYNIFDAVNGKNENILVKFNNYQNGIINVAESFSTNIEDVLKGQNRNLLPTEVSKSLEKMDSCNIVLKEDIENAKAIVNIALNVIKPFKTTANNADQISEKVLSFNINDLPSIGYINLKSIGARKNGNQLIIRLKKITEGDKNNLSRDETIEMRTITLQQLSFYSISKVTLILAIPTGSQKVELQNKNDVQFAPSGSLLFKYGSRNKKTWNFLDPGFGFNISTPDFNMDGTPDVGLGVIGTLLKDVISFGVSYNTTTNTPFWFVGLSIPVTMPGLPINTVKTE